MTHSTVVATRYGKVGGMKVGNVYCWKGVPYARPPLGRLRFRPPEPPEPWSGVRDATKFGPSAPQTWDTDGVPQSEDCLYLNIWSPGADNRRRPVMVWFHGGGFMVGSGSDPRTDGASFAEQGDLVLVTVNYRLAALGFLYLGHLDEEYAVSGNSGFLDQIAALKWVRDNIEAFGGDPERVTIFGQSAGARSIGLHLAAPGSRGLFRQAIIQSGMLGSYRSVEQAVEITDRVLHRLQISAKELHRLHEVTVEQIIAASPPVRPEVGLEATVDGLVIPRPPMEALAAGASQDIPVMMGTTLHEITPTFDPMWKDMSDEQLLDLFRSKFASDWPKVSGYYLNRNPEEPLIHRLARMATFQQYHLAAIRLAEIRERQGHPIRIYRFDRTSQALGGLAPHGLEVPFVFNNIHVPKVRHIIEDTPDTRTLAMRMHRAWIAFAHSGNPNADGLPEWPAYRPDERAVMLWNAECRVAPDPDSEERRLWTE